MIESISTTRQLLEKLSALHRSLMRRFATERGLQFVHIEIMQYLSACNRYSDTTQTISEYLGQTKGSISQSLGYLEENDFVKRTQDTVDKRTFHLSLSTKGRSICRQLFHRINLDGSEKIESALKTVLAEVQKRHGLRGYGICRSCKFNQSPLEGQFTCGLTKEKLSTDDVKKICKEHEPSEVA